MTVVLVHSNGYKVILLQFSLPTGFVERESIFFIFIIK
jgi:hypothetical protein